MYAMIHIRYFLNALNFFYFAKERYLLAVLNICPYYMWKGESIFSLLMVSSWWFVVYTEYRKLIGNTIIIIAVLNLWQSENQPVQKKVKTIYAGGSTRSDFLSVKTCRNQMKEKKREKYIMQVSITTITPVPLI